MESVLEREWEAKMTHLQLPTLRTFSAPVSSVSSMAGIVPGLVDAQRIFKDRMDLCMDAGVHACACLPVYGSHACTHACTYTALPHLNGEESGELGCTTSPG